MLLSIITFLPLLVASLLILPISGRQARFVAFIVALVVFGLSVLLLQGFDSSTHQIQFAEMHPWISSFGINYFIGIDGISIWLVMLTTFLIPVTILASWNSVDKHIKSFHASILILETAMLGAFVSLDAVL